MGRALAFVEGDLGLVDRYPLGQRLRVLEVIPEPAALFGFVEPTRHPPLVAHTGTPQAGVNERGERADEAMAGVRCVHEDRRRTEGGAREQRSPHCGRDAV